MSNIKDQIPFADFGLNQDDSYKYIQKGNAPYHLNCLKGEDGNYGEITNLKGNRKVTYQLGNANTYFVLWSCYDPLTRNVYYYVFSQPYDTTGSNDFEYDNRILRFNEDTEVIDTIFYDTRNYFRFDPTKPIKDAFVLGDWLYVNPQESEPKMFHIEMLYNYTNNQAYDATSTYTQGVQVTYFGGLFLADEAIGVGETPVTDTDKWTRIGDSYQNETDLAGNIYYDSEFRYAFNVLKHIPIYRPICTYASDLDKNANNVRGKLFRFAYRYKYFDNTYSRYSAYSDITLPQYDEYYNGEVPGDLDEFNCIDVSVRLHSPAIVKEVDIIFQETNGIWKRAKIVNRKDIVLLNQIAYTYRFYNTDSAYEVIDDTYFHEPYDAVPKKAKSQEIINKNILCFGGCTEGFDNIDKNEIDVSLTPEIEAITILDSMSVGGLRRDLLLNGDITTTYTSDYGENERITTTINTGDWYPGDLAIGDIFRVTLNNIQRIYVIGAADLDSNLAFNGAIRDFLVTEFPNIPLDGENWEYTTIDITVNNYIAATEFIFYQPSGSAEVSLTKKRGFKTGAWHPFCIYYYDSVLRRWDAQTSKALPEGDVAWQIDGTTVYVPMFSEDSPVPATTAHKWNINWEVNHLPPEGAKWWRWGYAGNALCSEFVQYIIEDIRNDEAPWTRLDITPLQTLKNPADADATWNEFPQSIITPYAWQHGDRVRIITEAGAGNNLGAVVDGVYDYEILKYDDTTTPGEYWIYVQDFDYVLAGIGENSLVEIYRPIKTDTARIFYEFGELMPIIEDSNGTLVHGCGSVGVQNQETATDEPAMGVFEAGDVYHILRTPSKPVDAVSTTEGYFHESMWYSDFYDSDDWDKGRIGTESNFGERFLNIVRYSDQYLQNTLINGMSTFHGVNYKELNDVYGEIMRIIEIGDTLKVYQRKKPSSILIGRTEYEDAEGNVTVAISERILGSIRYSNTNYGTEFPESISRNNRYVYGFDIHNGVLFRDGANGIFPISGRYESTDGGGDYKMETFFKLQAKNMLVSGIAGCSVLTTWDERHKNLYVVFKDLVTDSNNKALMFHEPSNKWICFTNMDQTPTEGWNEIVELDWWVLWGFENGIGYLFDEDTRFAMFDFITTSNNTVFPARQDLTLATLAPTIICDANLAMGFLPMTLTPPLPVPIASWITSDHGALGLGEDATTIGEATTTVVRCYTQSSESQYMRIIIDSISSTDDWLRVTTSYGSDYNEEDIVIYGYDTLHTPPELSYPLYFFSRTENPGAVRAGTVTLRDNFGNTRVITITQAANTLPVTVPISVKYGDAWLSLTWTEGVGTAGDTTVYVSFIPVHSAYISGTIITVYWELGLYRPGVYDTPVFAGAGYWNDIVNREVNNLKQAYSTISPLGGDTIYVYLSVVYVDIQDAVVGTPPGLTLATLTPTVWISACVITGSPLTFNPADSYEDHAWADAQTINVLGLPFGAKIASIESWLVVGNLADTRLYVGDTVNASGNPLGEDIKIVPYSANTGGSRGGSVRFTVDTYGDTALLIVYHNPVPAVFDASDTPSGGVFKSSSATAAFTLLGASHAYCTPATNDMNLIFGTFDYTKVPIPPNYDPVYYTVYYRVYVKYFGLSDYELFDSGSISNCYNYCTVNQWLELSGTVTVADSIQVYLSDMIFYSRS